MKGVSCLLVNNDRGREFIESSNALDLYPVEFDDIAKGNDQLRHPSVLPKDRRLYVDAYANGGWSTVVRLYKKRERGVVFYAKKALRAVCLRQRSTYSRKLLVNSCILIRVCLIAQS